MRPGIAMALMRAAADQSCIDKQQLFGACTGDRQPGALVEWRNPVIWLMRHRVGLSYRQIGKFLARDHSTIIHALGWMDRRADDATTQRRVETIWERANALLDRQQGGMAA